MSHHFIPPLADPAEPSRSGAAAKHGPGVGRPRSPLSAWPVLGVLAGLLWVAVLQGVGGVVLWILAAAVVLLLTALYALGFRRRSWAGLDTLEQRRFALSVSGVVLTVGLVAGVMSAPQPALVQNPAAAPPPAPQETQPPDARPEAAPGLQDLRVDVQGAKVPADAEEDGPATPAKPAPAQAALANSPCGVEGETRVQQLEYRCTPNAAGELIWMEKNSAELLVEQRAAVRQAQDAAREAARQEEDTTPPPGSPPEVPPPVPGPTQPPEPAPDPTIPPDPTAPPDPRTPPDPTAPPDPTTPPPQPPEPGTPEPGTPNPDPTIPNPNPPNPTQPPASGRAQSAAPVPDTEPSPAPVSGTLQSP